MLTVHQKKVAYPPEIAAPRLLLVNLSTQHMNSETVYRLSAVLHLLLRFTVSTPRFTKMSRGEI